MGNACGIIGSGTKTVKLHHLIKAPENSPESIKIRESWDANKPVTVYKTPEILPNGEICTAATVILRTKGCAWWWKSGCTFCGYFNDVRDDVTTENMFSQWEEDSIFYLPHITKIMLTTIAAIYTVIRIIWLPLIKGFNLKNLNFINWVHFIFINITIDSIKLAAFIVSSFKNLLSIKVISPITNIFYTL